MPATPEKPRSCKTIDELKVGDTFTRNYTISYDDVRKFAEICGDWNPVHHDPEYAAQTFFKAQIAHGMISVSKFSGIFGMDTPGLGTLYLTQNTEFLAPVYLDKPYKATATITKIDVEKNVATYTTVCTAEDGTEVVRGEATVKAIPEKVRAKTDVSTYVDATASAA